MHYGDVLIKYGSVLDLEDDDLPRIADPAAVEKMTSDSLRDGDIVIADTAEDLTAGKCSELRNIGESVVFAGLHTMPCRPVNQYAAGFLGHYLNSSSFHDQLIPLMQGIKVIALSKAAMGVAALMVPSFAEQQAIGRFFSSLDSLITLHQRKSQR
ncbi:restriction endonuclease subunit S [Bifidobacterium goeldii]|uniref:Restriction endonuclease subunit S n=1 Tax=Bifidobacterium goeldii TaxID=2306975 RepID=A0A430FKD4_9BIFI|nr:restriction endonuclease subunit S [Bifidobacterium goeldii]